MALAALTACTSVVPVKDVTADKVGYLNKKFPTNLIRPAVAGSTPATSPDLGFRQLVIKFDSTGENSDGKKDSWQREITYINQGNGLVQEISESANNGISFELDYSLTYRGFMGLRWQSVPLRGNLSSLLFEIKEASRFDPLPTAPGQAFVVDYATGTEQQIMNYYPNKRSCKSTGYRPAGEIHAKLSGQALIFECENISNNTVQSRNTWAVLPGYGVAIVLETTNSTRKTSHRVIDIQG